MKVHVEFTVDIDPEAWDAAYGTGTDPKVVREDVRIYVENVIRGQLYKLRLLTTDD
jgi:hypothetical protein